MSAAVTVIGPLIPGSKDVRVLRRNQFLYGVTIKLEVRWHKRERVDFAGGKWDTMIVNLEDD